MGKIWEPQSIEIYLSWINAIEFEASEKLTSWEIDFTQSLSSRLNAGSNLTERQAEILERIYSEKT